MWHRNAIRLSCLFSLVVLQTGLTLSPRPVFAGPEPLRVFRVGGGVQATMPVKRPIPGSVFVKLSPQAPSVSNKAVLVFDHPKLVETGKNYAVWTENFQLTPDLQGGLWLWLHPAKGSKYLIDCAVEWVYDWDKKPDSITNEQFLFKVIGPDGTAPLTVTALDDPQHLQFVLESTEYKWVSFQIVGRSTGGLAA